MLVVSSSSCCRHLTRLGWMMVAASDIQLTKLLAAEGAGAGRFLLLPPARAAGCGVSTVTSELQADEAAAVDGTSAALRMSCSTV